MLPSQVGWGLNGVCKVQKGRAKVSWQCQGYSGEAVGEKLVLALPGAAGDGQTCTAPMAGWMLAECQWDTG